MATADASGPFQWPLIDGMVAANGAGDVAVESKRCCKSRLGSFSRWFPERRAGSRILPDSRVERGAERHNAPYGKALAAVVWEKSRNWCYDKSAGCLLSRLGLRIGITVVGKNRGRRF
jgi:hypothetical protein